MNNIYNEHSTNMDNTRVEEIVNSANNVNTGNTVKKSLMRKISIAIVLLVVIYGGYLTFKTQFASVANKDLNEGINTNAQSYILLNDLASKLNFKNSNIEKYSFEWNGGNYDGYSISTVSYVGVAESPFNEELKSAGFTEDVNNLAEGHTAGLSVYSKDNLICIIENDAVNPNSWGTDNPDYSSTQTFACADKNSEVK